MADLRNRVGVARRRLRRAVFEPVVETGRADACALAEEEGPRARRDAEVLRVRHGDEPSAIARRRHTIDALVEANWSGPALSALPLSAGPCLGGSETGSTRSGRQPTQVTSATPSQVISEGTCLRFREIRGSATRSLCRWIPWRSE